MFCKPNIKDTKEQVKCEECKHYIDEADAQKVKAYIRYTYTSFTSFYDSDIHSCYYCPMHKRPYDEVWREDGKEEYFKTIPEHKDRVNEDGTPYIEPSVKRGRVRPRKNK